MPAAATFPVARTILAATVILAAILVRLAEVRATIVRARLIVRATTRIATANVNAVERFQIARLTRTAGFVAPDQLAKVVDADGHCANGVIVRLLVAP